MLRFDWTWNACHTKCRTLAGFLSKLVQKYDSETKLVKDYTIKKRQTELKWYTVIDKQQWEY